MMRLTAKNRAELRLLEHYMTLLVDVTHSDIAAYFDWSDRGLHKDEVENRVANETQTGQYTGLSALYYAKRNRDLSITSYLEDWGTQITAIDFVDEPREVAEFVAKALNKPAILVFWKLHNDEDITSDEMRLLRPLAALRGGA